MNRRDVFKIFGGSAAIPAVQSVEQLKVESGDTLVLKFKQRLTQENHEQIRRTFNNSLSERFPDLRLIILDNGADIQVLKRK